MIITPSKLYNYLMCEHRVWRDLYGPLTEKNPEANPFVEMLWEKGVSHEEDIIKKIGDVLNLKDVKEEDRELETLSAMKSRVPLIYQGAIRSGELYGIPDLLELQANGTYLPVDIKSGMGVEGVDEDNDIEGKYKKHYAVQLALYSEILINLGLAKKHAGAIIDINSDRTEYDLDKQIGVRTPQTYWDYYQELKIKVGKLLKNETKNKPSYSGKCKLCPWYASCKKWIKENHDPSMIFYLGRANRDVLENDLDIESIKDLININLDSILDKKKKDKKFLVGLGETKLNKFIQRSKIIEQTKAPVIYEKPDFPKTRFELYFDIEDDPTQAFVYLHGVYERSPKGERFVDFTAKDKTDQAEKDAWSRFWQYIRTLPKDDFTTYYYSHHEKTTYKSMRQKYPDVVSEEDLEWFFSDQKAIDLYSFVSKHTDWPLMSYSLKEIAQYLGFSWRDKSPSGALSIEWFNRYLQTKDQKDMDRILLYNEDDCVATMVIKDFLDKDNV